MFLVYQALNEQCNAAISAGDQIKLELSLQSGAKCVSIPQEVQMDVDQFLYLAKSIGEDLTNQDIRDFIIETIEDLFYDEGIEEDFSDITADIANNIKVSGSIPGAYPSAMLCVLFEKKACQKYDNQSFVTLSGISLMAKQHNLSLCNETLIPIPFGFYPDPSYEEKQAQTEKDLQKSKSATVTSSVILAVIIVILVIILAVMIVKQKKSKSQSKSRDQRVVQQSTPMEMISTENDDQQQPIQQQETQQ